MTQDIGGIYSDAKCPLCGGNYVDDHKSALRCMEHPQHIAGRFKVKIRDVCARFDNYTDAKLFLKAKREDVRAGTLTLKKDQKTLGHLMDSFLDWKDKLVEYGKIKEQTVITYHHRLKRMVDHIGVARLADEIEYKHMHNFLYSTDFSTKSKYDSYTVFKEMMILARNLGFIKELPQFPDWQFDLEHDMERRKTIDKETQEKILEQIWLNTADRPMLYLAIKFLATYINLRPNELRMLNVRDFDRAGGYLVVKRHKTSKTPKIIKLTEDDAKALRSYPRAFPDVPLFRSGDFSRNSDTRKRFGKNAFYRAWKRACDDIGVYGVDLYGGTRHSSAIALYKDHGLSPEQIKKATGHKTSVAFTRYFRMDIDDIVHIHALAAPGCKGSVDISKYVEVKDVDGVS